MALETITLEHIPSTHVVHVVLFRNVTNSAFLHSQLLARNSDFEYAFIDASSVLSRLHVLAATFKALTVLLEGTLKTPNVHSEIVCSLSASKNISDAYRRYGMTPATRDLLVVKVTFPTATQSTAPTADQVWAHLRGNVEGDAVAFGDQEIAACTDLARVRKGYKMNGAACLDGLAEGPARLREMEMLALGAMALRGL